MMNLRQTFGAFGQNVMMDSLAVKDNARVKIGVRGMGRKGVNWSDTPVDTRTREEITSDTIAD